MSPASHWTGITPLQYFILVGALILFAAYRAFRPLLAGQADLWQRHDWGWGLVILAILAAGRWPSLIFPRELDGDESQLFAGAAALAHDPVFWRSVDGHTSGPLNFFALWPAGALVGWNDYLAPRLTAFALIACSLILAQQCVSLLAGRTAARIAGLGTLCWEAMTNAIGLLHYSSELVSVTLLTGAGYVVIRRQASTRAPLWNLLGGVLLGAVPLAKLQATPLALALGLAWWLGEMTGPPPDRLRRVAWLTAGALLPLSLFVIQLGLVGEFRNAYIPYILNNLGYTQTGLQSSGNLPIWERFLRISIEHDSLTHLWLPTTVVASLLMLRWPKSPGCPHRRHLVSASLFFLLSLVVVVIPGRPFLHYMQLAAIPATLLLGTVIGSWLAGAEATNRRARQWLVVFCAGLIVAPLLGQRAVAPNELLGANVSLYQYRRSRLSERILPHVRPGDRVVIWGWSCFVYVETGLRQATRDAHVQFALMPGPYLDYYRERLLDDFSATLPEFFLDSTGAHSLLFRDAIFRHEQILPELAALVREHYVLIEEFEGARLYQRKDLRRP